MSNTSASFIFNRVTLPDDCVGPDIEPVIAFALSIELPTRERHPSGDRFSVFIDGSRTPLKRVDSLRKFLQSVVIGARCRVFRNADKCVTFNFEA